MAVLRGGGGRWGWCGRRKRGRDEFLWQRRRAAPPSFLTSFGEALLGLEVGPSGAALDDGLAFLMDAAVERRPDLGILQLRRLLRLLRRRHCYPHHHRRRLAGRPDARSLARTQQTLQANLLYYPPSIELRSLLPFRVDSSGAVLIYTQLASLVIFYRECEKGVSVADMHAGDRACPRPAGPDACEEDEGLTARRAST